MLPPILFNLFLEGSMKNEYRGSVTVGGKKIRNLRFADGIDQIAGNSEELQDLTDRLKTTASALGMEISAEERVKSVHLVWRKAPVKLISRKVTKN